MSSTAKPSRGEAGPWLPLKMEWCCRAARPELRGVPACSAAAAISLLFTLRDGRQAGRAGRHLKTQRLKLPKA